MELLQGAGNVFVTGGAGTGKSYLIREFMREKDPKDFPLLASTGAAAVVIGGRTFHSFFGLGILEGGVEATVERALGNRNVTRRVRRISGFIVDEVSMLSAETLRAAELIARRARKSDEFWGGIKVVAVGDFAQLPPVQRDQRRKSWVFEDDLWRVSQFQVAYLKTQVRCQDPDYMSVLDRVRLGDVNSHVIEFLNARVHRQAQGDETHLFPRRQQTDDFNESKLNELSTPLKVLESEYSGQARAIEQLKKLSPIPESLKLKEGAMVMIRQNDPAGRWVNGSTGILEKIASDHLRIELQSGRRAQVEQATFTYLDAEGFPIAAMTNFPVTLAYASTIHKAQGLTLNRVYVNLDRLWEPGQAYVALSRVRTAQDLKIESWQPRSIKVDPAVQAYYLTTAPLAVNQQVSEPSETTVPVRDHCIQ